MCSSLYYLCSNCQGERNPASHSVALKERTESIVLSQEIERNSHLYFCLPTDVFTVEDALSACRWVRYRRAGSSQQTHLNSLILPSLWRILNLNDISCRYTLILHCCSHRKCHLLGPCIKHSYPISLFPTPSLSSVETQPCGFCTRPSLSLVSPRSLSFLLQLPDASKGFASLLPCPWNYRGLGNASTCQQLAPKSFGASQTDPQLPHPS